MSSSEAAASLATPPQRGTLSLAFRRSVVALQSTFGFPGAAEQAEREQFDGADGVQSYGSVMDLPPERRVPRPRPVKSAVRVEAKVWFANERTWISWLRVSVLLGSFALALFNSSAFFNHHTDVPGQEPGPKVPRGPNPNTIKTFGIVYAVISVSTLAWGLYSYQRRVTMIKNKWAGDFDDLIGPPVICVALFAAVLINFIVRVQQFNAL